MNVCNGHKYFYLISYANIHQKIKHKQKCKLLFNLRVIDKVIPRLSHINPAVVFGCIKLIVRYLDYLSG